MTDGYRYVGGGRWLPAVPARDLTADEAARLPERVRARLTASGLYRIVPTDRAAAAPKEVKPNV